MADIPTANIDYAERITLGNKLMWKARIKGDGSGVTVPVPLGRIEGYWICNIDDTSAIPAISWATNILTYAAAPTNTKYHWLFVIGSD